MPANDCGDLAQVYRFTDLDGSRRDAWRHVEVQDAGNPADTTGHR